MKLKNNNMGTNLLIFLIMVIVLLILVLNYINI